MKASICILLLHGVNLVSPPPVKKLQIHFPSNVRGPVEVYTDDEVRQINSNFNSHISMDYESNAPILTQVQVKEQQRVVPEVALVATDEFRRSAPYITTDTRPEETVAIDENGAELVNAPDMSDAAISFHQQLRIDYEQVAALANTLTALNTNYPERPVLVQNAIAKELSTLLGHLVYLHERDSDIVSPPEQSEERRTQQVESESESEGLVEAEIIDVTYVPDLIVQASQIKSFYLELFHAFPNDKGDLPRDPKFQLAPALEIFSLIADFSLAHAEKRPQIEQEVSDLRQQIEQVSFSLLSTMRFYELFDKFVAVEHGAFSRSDIFVAKMQELKLLNEHFARVMVQILRNLRATVAADNRLVLVSTPAKEAFVTEADNDEKATVAVEVGLPLLETRDTIYQALDAIMRDLDAIEKLKEPLVAIILDLEAIQSGKGNQISTNLIVSEADIAAVKTRQAKAHTGIIGVVIVLALALALGF